MRIIKPKFLRDFWEKHPEAEKPLKAWLEVATLARWEKPADVKNDYKSASIVTDNRVVFNIKGNHYRLVVKFHYNTKIGFLRFVGTHKEYDKTDVEKV